MLASLMYSSSFKNTFAANNYRSFTTKKTLHKYITTCLDHFEY